MGHRASEGSLFTPGCKDDSKYISESVVKDKMVWDEDRKCIFIVRSAYRLA